MVKLLPSSLKVTCLLKASVTVQACWQRIKFASPLKHWRWFIDSSSGFNGPRTVLPRGLGRPLTRGHVRVLPRYSRLVRAARWKQGWRSERPVRRRLSSFLQTTSMATSSSILDLMCQPRSKSRHLCDQVGYTDSPNRSTDGPNVEWCWSS